MGMAATLGLGVLFVVLQFALWQQLASQGVTVQTGVVGMVIYMLTALHAVHVLMGMMVLVYLLSVAYRSAPGAMLQRSAMRLRLCGMFWHFVDAVWMVMFVGLFLV